MSKRKREKPGNQQVRGRPWVPAESREAYWIYGHHAARAALDNPHRTVKRTLATRNAAEWLGKRDHDLELVAAEEIASRLPAEAVHQGLAVLVDPLDTTDLADVAAAKAASLLVLDQVSDPHNVGAILRSCAAFGATALVVQARHSPPESGALAKAASGALETVPIVRVTNIARALEWLGEHAYMRIGLDGQAETTLSTADVGGPVALVLGAEGKGLRRLSRENCDVLVRIETGGTLASLNVSNAAAIALYEITRRQIEKT